MRYSTFIVYQDICKIVLLLVHKTNYLKSRAWAVRTYVYTNACVRAGGVRVCMRVKYCVCTSLCVCVFVCVCVCTCVRAGVPICVRVDVGTLYVCMYVFVYMCLCECVFVYG